MPQLLNLLLSGKHNRPIVTDIFYTPNNSPKPVVIFIHGFKGFKDWGHFNLVADYFAQAGFVMVKFNFSHNGTTPEHLTEFADPEAFANNNFSIELDDLGVVIDTICGNNPPINRQEIDAEQVYLIGHSRGGGIAILKAQEDKRVKKIATWASVSEFGKFWSSSVIEQWRSAGVWQVLNTRTGEQLPMYWQLYENYYANLARLHIPTAIKHLQIPLLVIHGTADDAVPLAAASELCANNPQYTQLLVIEQANHVFGASHPYHATQLPEHSQRVCQATAQHFGK
jgi:dienelactone hydrolase